MFCTNCGAANADGTKFCVSCGSPLAQPQYQQPNYQQPNYQQPNFQQQGYQQPNFQQPNYQQQGYQQQVNYGGYRAPIVARKLITCIILSIVTFGIYGIIWMISIVDDLNTAAQTPGEPSGGTVFLLTLVTCGIYSYIWMYKAGEKVDRIRQMNGMPAGNNTSLVYLLLSVFGLGIVAYYLIQSELNNVAMSE